MKRSLVSRVRKRTPAGSRTRPRSRLQERKQELVREELSRAAWALFRKEGYEATTVTEIARKAGVSRRTFFRYYASKEDVVVETSDELVEEVLVALAHRPAKEPPLVAIRRAIVPALEKRLKDSEQARGIIRLLRESRSLRRALLERHARMEERLAAQLAARLEMDPATNSRPALLAFLARAMMDTAFNVWYDQRRIDVAGLIDELFAELRDLTRAR